MVRGRTRPHQFLCAILVTGGGTVLVEALRTGDSANTSATESSADEMAVHMDVATLTADSSSTEAGVSTYALPATTCRYRPPNKAGEGGYEGMENLTDPGWVAQDGTNADGRHVLFYAYGPLFQGTNQIAAWAYDDAEGFITQWWSMRHCMGATTQMCPHLGGSNMPTAAAFVLNPSATVTSAGYTLVHKFTVNSVIDTPVGSMKLVQLGDAYRLQMNGCYLDHVYVCAKYDFIPFLKNETGGNCEDQLFAPTIGLDEDDCEDHSIHCPQWAAEGRCEREKETMLTICQESCKVCEAKEDDDLYAFWNVEIPEGSNSVQEPGNLTFPKYRFQALGFKIGVASVVTLLFLVVGWRCCCRANRRSAPPPPSTAG